MVTHILYRPHNNDSVSRISDTEVDVPLANFRESRICELRLVLTPMGENFSGSCIVTSRNPFRECPECELRLETEFSDVQARSTEFATCSRRQINTENNPY
jgi:hypothetical protein